MSVLTLSSAAAAADADAYIAALLGFVGTRDPAGVLAATPDEITAIIAGLTPKQVVQPERPGKWSVRHLIQHLADSELVGGYRMRAVLAQERPPLTGYDQDLWAGRLRYDEIDVREALEQFTLLRRVNLRYWRSLSARELQRVGVHNERGEESLDRMRRLYAGHDLAHLAQLRRIVGAVTG